MFDKVDLPNNAVDAIAGSSGAKKQRILNVLEDKMKSIFYKKAYEIYDNIYSTSLDNFIGSFVLTDNDGVYIKYFVDEEVFNNNSIYFEQTSGGFGEGIPVINTSNNQQKLDILVEGVHMDAQKYFSDDFWEDFHTDWR